MDNIVVLVIGISSKKATNIKQKLNAGGFIFFGLNFRNVYPQKCLAYVSLKGRRPPYNSFASSIPSYAYVFL